MEHESLRGEGSTESRAEVIRKLFVANGGNTMSRRHFAELLRFDEDLYPDDIAEETLITGIMRELESALKAIDPSTALPFALPSAKLDGRSRIWMQPALFDFDDMVFVISHNVRGVKKDAAGIRRLCNLCVARFGRLPEVDGLAEILALANGD